MLDKETIEELLKHGESDRLEFKPSDTYKDKINQAVCSFANDLSNSNKPGYILIGVNDHGIPSGLNISDELLRNLAAVRSDGNILPFPTMNVEKICIQGRNIAIMEIFPSYSPPVRYKGIVYISVGPTRRIATPDEERRLVERKRSGNLPFDMQPVPGATLKDLDVDAFQRFYLPFAVAPEVIDENSRSTEQQLVSLRFLSSDFLTPTNAGILVIGIDPQAWLPGAYLQYVRYDGIDQTHPIKDHRRITDNLISQLSKVKDLLPSQIQVAQSSPDGIVNVDRPDYPIEALSELLFNAFLHRNYEATNSPIRYYQYEDRIEILSPGGLYGLVNPDNFDQGATDYRNPMLAEAMKSLGYVQKFGRGIPKAKSTLMKNGNPPPEFIFEPTHIMVTIRRS